MTILADESVAQAIVEQLRQDGHSVAAIGELSPGITDDQVLATAVNTYSLLLTEDKDFGEMVHRQGAAHRGVVLVRLAGVSRAARATLVSQAFQLHEAEFVGAFSVVSKGGIRIRPATPPSGSVP